MKQGLNKLSSTLGDRKRLSPKDSFNHTVVSFLQPVGHNEPQIEQEAHLCLSASDVILHQTVRMLCVHINL